MFDVMPFRVLYLAALPAGAQQPVWTSERCEAWRFDHHAEADAIAKKIRDEGGGDMHTHAVVLSTAHDKRRPVQMQLAMPDMAPRKKRPAPFTATTHERHHHS